MSMTTFRRPSSAFTLLETLLAGAMIVLAVTASIGTGRAIQQSAAHAEETARLSSLVQEGFSQLAVAQDLGTTSPVAFSVGVSWNGYVTFSGNAIHWNSGTESITLDGASYTRKLTVKEDAASHYLAQVTAASVNTGFSVSRTWVITDWQ